MDSLQGIPAEYKLDTFNMPRTGTTYVTPKIGYVNAMALFRSRHLAINSPLGHFNGDQFTLSTRHTKTTVTPKFNSYNGNMAFAKLRRTQSLARPTIRAAFLNFLITPFRLYTHNLSTSLAAQTQTTFSMLQIKTILKNTFRLLSSSLYFTQPSEEVTKHTPIRHNSSSLK